MSRVISEIRVGRRTEGLSSRMVADPASLKFQKDHPANDPKIVHAVCDHVRRSIFASTVSPNETGAPHQGSSGQRAGSRSGRPNLAFPLRPGPNRIFSKPPGISVVGVLNTHDAWGRGVS